VIVVCCQIEVFASGWSLIKRSTTECGASECVLESSITRRPWHTGGWCTMIRSNFRGFLWNLVWEFFFSQRLTVKFQFHETVLSAGRTGRSVALMCVVVSVSWDCAQCGPHWPIGRADVCCSFHSSWLIWPNCDVQIFPRSAGFSRECCQNCVQWAYILLESVNRFVHVFCTLVLRSGYNSFAPDVDKFHCLRVP